MRGQYGAGAVERPQARRLPRSPANVARTSRTETFVALKLAIDNWRWSGVPFYLRTGKAMRPTTPRSPSPSRPRHGPSSRTPRHGPSAPNVLVLHIQPREGIALEFEAKRPGPDVRPGAPCGMDFRYADWFKTEPATGYETLIYDVLIGDQTLFNRAQDIEYAWRAVTPFLEAWKSGGEVHRYAAGERWAGRRRPTHRRATAAPGGRSDFVSTPPAVRGGHGRVGRRQDHGRQGPGERAWAGRSRRATTCIPLPTSPR